MSSSNLNVAKLTILDMPVDIFVDILLGLPVETLVLLSCVCKAWYVLIKSPDFIYKHLKKSSLNPKANALLVSEMNRDFDDYNILLLYEDSLDEPFELDSPFIGVKDEYRSVIGVCNGLVCVSLSYIECQLILFNPATRQSNRIPHWRWWDDKLKEIVQVTGGFGFDPTIDDYKLIRFVRYERLNLDVIDHAEIYSMNTDNWRHIHMPFSFSPSYLVAIPGMFYWETRDFAYPNMTIMSFDMNEEVFRVIEGPQHLSQRWDETKHMLVGIREELALVVMSDERWFTAWVLNADNSWSKKFKIGPVIGRPIVPESHLTVIGCSRNGDLVFEDNRGLDMDILLYDLNNQAIKTLPFDKFCYYYHVYGFIESLVPVKKV